MDINEMPDLEHILKDIRAIKTALHRHDHVIRQILLPKYFGLMSAYYGGAMLFVFGLFQGFILYYGAYDHIPPVVRYLLWAFFAFATVSGGIIKLVSLTRASRELSGPTGVFSLYAGILYLTPQARLYRSCHWCAACIALPNTNRACYACHFCCGSDGWYYLEPVGRIYKKPLLSCGGLLAHRERRSFLFLCSGLSLCGACPEPQPRFFCIRPPRTLGRSQGQEGLP